MNRQVADKRWWTCAFCSAVEFLLYDAFMVKYVKRIYFFRYSDYTENMIKTILLDLDDTIFDFKECERQALSATLVSFNLDFQKEDLSDYSEINEKMWKLLEKGEINREELKIKRFELFLSRYPSPPSAERFAEGYMTSLSNTSSLIDGAKEVLTFLSGKYDLYAVTNGYERTQYGRIRASGIGMYFKDIFISEKVGAAKPKKAFFDYCVAHIPGFSFSESVLIGDSPTSDIAGGKAYGLFTIRYNPTGAPNPEDAIPDREYSSLSELPALLRTLDEK